MHRKTSHKKHWWGSLWAPASSNLSMFCLFVGSKCLRGSKLLITSIARKIQVILSAVSFKHSCIFKWLVAMYAMKHDGILAVHCVLVFSQTFICYKCLVTLVTHVIPQCSWNGSWDLSSKAYVHIGMATLFVIFQPVLDEEVLGAFIAGKTLRVLIKIMALYMIQGHNYPPVYTTGA